LTFACIGDLSLQVNCIFSSLLDKVTKIDAISKDTDYELNNNVYVEAVFGCDVE